MSRNGGGFKPEYPIEQAVKDKATVPIYYESRLAELQLSEDKKDIDSEVDDIMEQSEETSDSYINEQKVKCGLRFRYMFQNLGNFCNFLTQT